MLNEVVQISSLLTRFLNESDEPAACVKMKTLLALNIFLNSLAFSEETFN